MSSLGISIIQKIWWLTFVIPDLDTVSNILVDDAFADFAHFIWCPEGMISDAGALTLRDSVHRLSFVPPSGIRIIRQGTVGELTVFGKMIQFIPSIPTETLP